MKFTVDIEGYRSYSEWRFGTEMYSKALIFFFQAKSKKGDLRLTVCPAAAPAGFPASYIEDQRARAACKRGTVVLRYPGPLVTRRAC